MGARETLLHRMHRGSPVNNARDHEGVVHHVKTDEDGHSFGELACRLLFYWQYSLVTDGGNHAKPVNPTKDPVTCLWCLPTS